MSYSKAMEAVLKMFGLGVRLTREKPIWPCITCGKPKQHNNAFCSAGCRLVYDMRNSPKS